MGAACSCVSWERAGGPVGRGCYGRVREEYQADFVLLAQRSLTPVQLAVFRTHHLLGADWRLSCRLLRMERGLFWHIVYDLEGRLGRVLAETLPYPLYPLASYFAGETRAERLAS
jgi:hypothetical protein